MPYNELRKDYLLNRWVVIATERSRRPTDFVKTHRENAKTSTCPLCKGNEHMTPPAVMLYLQESDGVKRTVDPQIGDRPKNWLIRCIPNLFPAFSPPEQLDEEKNVLKNNSLGYAVGHHEVLIESPVHDEGPADVELPQLERLINAYIDRLKELSAIPYIKYISIFRNYGSEGGASLSHAHSQVVATSIIPTTIQEELNASKEFYEKNKKCVFCDIIERESKSSRLIHENEYFLVLAPYASITPMEFWIIPRRHSQNLMDLTTSEISMFAKTLKTSLKALKDLVDDPPYNYGFHLALNQDTKDFYHWHLEVYPRLSIWAGFELSTGFYINTIMPEIAAESLRKIIET